MDASSARVRITVQLRADVARELTAHHSRSESTTSLFDLIEPVGAAIEPAFAGTVDPELGSWFTVIAAEQTASGLLMALQRHEAVLAAYIKPPESPP